MLPGVVRQNDISQNTSFQGDFSDLEASILVIYVSMWVEAEINKGTLHNLSSAIKTHHHVYATCSMKISSHNLRF